MNAIFYFKQLPEEEAVLLLVEEEEGVAEVAEEGEEDDHTTGSQNIKCRHVEWREPFIIVAFKITQTENATPCQVVSSCRHMYMYVCVNCIQGNLLAIFYSLWFKSELPLSFLITHHLESHCNEGSSLQSAE